MKSRSNKFHSFFSSNNIAYSNCESMENQPIINNTLALRKESFAMVRAVLFPNNVNKTPSCVTNLAFSELTTNNFTILNQNIFVFWTGPIMWLFVLIISKVLYSWQNKAKYLFSRPQTFWFQDARLRNPFNIFNPHQQLHKILFI